MARHAALRASDADREAVAERLRVAAVEGRLDADELDQRLHVALRARTYGQLERLLDDLPGAPGPWRAGGSAAVRASAVAVVLAVRLVAFLVVTTVVIALATLAAALWLLRAVVWLIVSRRLAPRRRYARGGRPASGFLLT
jgi:hypothetical protein